MKVIVTSLKVGTSVKGNEYARVSCVNLSDGSVFEGFVDPAVAKGIEAVDLSELEALADEVQFDQKGRIVSFGK